VLTGTTGSIDRDPDPFNFSEKGTDMKTLTGSIRTSNGQNMLTAVNGGGLGGPDSGSGLVALHTDAATAAAWETFRLILRQGSAPIGPGMTFALQTSSGRNYLTAVDGGGVSGPNDATCPIHTDAATQGPWETFTLNIDDSVNPPTLTIQTITGNFLTAVNGGGVKSPGNPPIQSDATAVNAWEVFSLSSPAPQAAVASQPYSFTLQNFAVNHQRANNFLGTEEDTDYAYFSVMVNGGPPQTQTRSMGNVSGGNTYNVGLTFSSIQVADTDTVTIQYHVINSGGGEQTANNILLQIGEKIGTAVAGLIATGIGGALGAALGAALGTAVVPLVGTALGALSGWIMSEVWTVVNADCDGPVASAVHIYSGAQLRVLTSTGAYTSSEDNPGINSPAGCGSNSDYTVVWSVSAG